MAASLTAVVGSRLYIGQAQADQSGDFVEADFLTHSYAEIGWIESIGAFGDESAEITFDAIGEARTKKLKGTRNAGNMEVTIGLVFDNAGQVALLAGEQTNFNYAFKVEFDDTPVGGTTPSKRYFIAKVMSARETLDTANNVIKLSATLGINSNIVRVDAA
jgi:hypothetical protein